VDHYVGARSQEQQIDGFKTKDRTAQFIMGYLTMNIEESKIEQIKLLCQQNKVKSLFVFGSVIRDDYNRLSDIDLVVDFDEVDPVKYTDLYFNLKSRLENILKRNVDLLEERAIRNRLFRQQIEKTKVLIYGHQN
jgi:predicted nucleotidyltransferase